MTAQAGTGRGEVEGLGRAGRFARMPRILVAVALAIVALGSGAQAALAYGTPLACASRSEAAVFAPWGDRATYFPVFNGGFESGSTGWLLANGARVVDGNEPYHVGGWWNGHSLRMTPGSSAESRTFCVSRGEDTLRLFVNNNHTSGAILHVDAIAVNPDNGAVGYSAFDVNGDVPSSPWAPTMQLKIPNVLGGSGTEMLTLRFSLRGTQTTWAIDDIYIDPFKSW
jgi:hypothetical protein